MSEPREIMGAALRPQVFFAMETPTPERFIAPYQRVPGYHGTKPGGGLWTSSLTDEGPVSDWAQWNIDNDCPFVDGRKIWILTVDPFARILLVGALYDLHGIIRQWPRKNGNSYYEEIRPDWLAIEKAGYDGVHLTKQGQWATRLSHPHNLYGWDCESTLWLRWCFFGVQPCRRDVPIEAKS